MNFSEHPSFQGTEPSEVLPDKIARYQVRGELGRGAQGTVYLAYDGELQRFVAIKSPHRSLLDEPDIIEKYLGEARLTSRWDHPHIVPVYDAGRLLDGSCFVVSKRIEGDDLASLLNHSPPDFTQAAQLIATLADALHYAHLRGLVHRDVKPSNVLMDYSGKPFLTDFGCALAADGYGAGKSFVGTPHYMSPEQARRESHRVDARADIFSLGVVFYQLLTRQLPFKGENFRNLCENINSQEPLPPRGHDPEVPAELERICLKAISKRASQRYQTAALMAEDLRDFLKEDITLDGTVTHFESRGQNETLRVHPKGLRTFDETDRVFFLSLLPGPRQRDGLPECVAFWKHRIERRNPHEAIPVGLIYGPTGSGKSSFVKAGLVPTLAPHVQTIYLVAGDDLESRMQQALDHQFSSLIGRTSLPDNLAEHLGRLRDQPQLRGDKKLLIVLDQMEQWLHAKNHLAQSPLAQALRQCDGLGVQCLLLARDDFWMAITELMVELELPPREGENTRAIDLFDQRHARNVLGLFGQGYGALAKDPQSWSADNHDFIEQAVLGLSVDGKVVCASLALFAQMVKDRPWTPDELRRMSGPHGAGFALLEETFGERYAPRRHYAKTVRAVLKELLPPHGQNITGAAKPESELLAASQLERRPQRLQEALTILDQELRLITPVSAAELEEGQNQNERSQNETQKRYQLTHDYIIRPLRDWLTWKQKETFRGRLRLRMEELSEGWSQSGQSRYLPSVSEFLLFLMFFVLLSPRGRARKEHREFLWAAARGHTRWGVVLGVLLALAAVGAELTRQQYIRNMVAAQIERLHDTDPKELLRIVDDLRSHHKVAVRLLRVDLNAENIKRRARAAAALTLLGEQNSVILVDSISALPDDDATFLTAALRTCPKEALPDLRDRFSKESELQPKARYAAVMCSLKDRSAAQECLQLTENRSLRTEFIHVWSDWKTKIDETAAWADKHPSHGVRSGIAKSLALMNAQTLPSEEREKCVTLLRSWYWKIPHGGVHSAAECALRRWGEDFGPPPLDAPADNLDSAFFTNFAGMTMIRIPPPQLGDPKKREPEKGGSKRDKRLFVASMEVSNAQFAAFVRSISPLPKEDELAEWKMTDPASWPVRRMTLNAMIRYCNWLSEKEGRRLCYRRRDGKWRVDESVDGYRLPRVAELEQAAGAGATTFFHFGDKDQEHRLKDYAAFLGNRRLINNTLVPYPCGSMLPNDWGMFDSTGNVQEWCWDTQKVEKVYGGGFFNAAQGGGFRNPANYCHWRITIFQPATTHNNNAGFRVICKDVVRPKARGK